MVQAFQRVFASAICSALKMPWSAGILPAFGAHFHGFLVPVSRRA
jgi:hypothetical protein